MNRLRGWELVQRMTQTFLSRWTSDYLNRLQSRPKWYKGNQKFKVNEVVLVKGEDNSWNLAKIIEVHPGTDDITRVVTLKTGKKIDLYNLAIELRVAVTSDDKIIDLREKITACTFFMDNEQFEKEMLDNIVEERKSLEDEAIKKIERGDKCLAEQRAFDLEKLKLQAQNLLPSVPSNGF
ncbi:integrase catalytic domain-containing protein [Trichonephila clavipes]|nr:integrase catalytic domain-containing protein [Trichonephila clavipes]